MMESNHQWYYEDLKQDRDIFFAFTWICAGFCWILLDDVGRQRSKPGTCLGFSTSSAMLWMWWVCASAGHISKTQKFGQAQAHQETCPQRARVRKRLADKVLLSTMSKLMICCQSWFSFWLGHLYMTNAYTCKTSWIQISLV